MVMNYLQFFSQFPNSFFFSARLRREAITLQIDQHRLPYEHDCPFDIRRLQRAKLKKESIKFVDKRRLDDCV